MIVDVDHLLANPIYQADRCSIGFHPLHSIILMPVYLLACFIPKLRLVGIGLVIHMILDSIDCRVNTGFWYSQITAQTLAENSSDFAQILLLWN